jgi:hypothetical protein
MTQKPQHVSLSIGSQAQPIVHGSSSVPVPSSNNFVAYRFGDVDANSVIFDCNGSMFSPMSQRMISTMDKEQHSSHRNSYIGPVMKYLPKELDVSSDDAFSQFIVDIEKLPKSILRHRGFYDKLYSRSNGELQRYVEMVMQSAPMDVVLVNLKKLTDLHEEGMFSPTPVGRRQILSPSYLPVWVVFRDFFLRDEDANWLEALSLFHKNDNFLQGSRPVHEYYGQGFLNRLRKWHRSPLPPRSDADNATDFVAGLNDDIQAVLSVGHSDIVGE